MSGVDRVIHEPARLIIVTVQYTVEEADLLCLMNVTGLTKGNFFGAPGHTGRSRVHPGREDLPRENSLNAAQPDL